LDPRAPKALDNWGNALTAHLIVLNGLVVGGWRRSVQSAEIDVRLDLPIPLRAAEQAALRRQAQQYATFMGVPVLLHW
jgi:hypothetical protein